MNPERLVALNLSQDAMQVRAYLRHHLDRHNPLRDQACVRHLEFGRARFQYSSANPLLVVHLEMHESHLHSPVLRLPCMPDPGEMEQTDRAKMHQSLLKFFWLLNRALQFYLRQPPYELVLCRNIHQRVLTHKNQQNFPDTPLIHLVQVDKLLR